MSAVAELIRKLYEAAKNYTDYEILECDVRRVLCRSHVTWQDYLDAAAAIRVRPRRGIRNMYKAILAAIIDRKASYDRCSFRTNVVPMP